MNTALTTSALQVPSFLRERGVGAVFAYTVPMRVRFRGISVREGLLLAGEDREAEAGPGAGWGECAPFWNYGPAHSAQWLKSALACVAGDLPAAAPLVPVNLTVPALNGAELEAYLECVLNRGGAGNVGQETGEDKGQGSEAAGGNVGQSEYRAVKIKVAQAGQELAHDVARVTAVRRALPGAAIRVDANAAWDAAQAVVALAAINEAAGGLEYCEQPCPSVAELAQVRAARICPIAADESIRHADDPLEVARQDAADYMVLKAAPLGGPLAAVRVAAQVGIPAIASSALDTSIGLAAGYRMASALAAAEGLAVARPAGLGTASLLAGDVVDNPLAPRGAALWEADLPGYAEITSGVQARLTPNEDLAARWQARLESMEEYL
ncbi:MAG: enolase C-terminal domain-like protein [Buchananella hordeovulneris]|nr:enolase C-terminal domain-like protein [Buchananella hordeovulneris]